MQSPPRKEVGLETFVSSPTIGAHFKRAPLESARGPLYLGIDAGSTTVKLAVIDDEARLLHSAYEPIKG
ncbi:MAG: hypothetical protein ACLTZW_09935, partial [Paratractidigestivibacter faecalis]